MKKLSIYINYIGLHFLIKIDYIYIVSIVIDELYGKFNLYLNHLNVKLR